MVPVGESPAVFPSFRRELALVLSCQEGFRGLFASWIHGTGFQYEAEGGAGSQASKQSYVVIPTEAPQERVTGCRAAIVPGHDVGTDHSISWTSPGGT